MRKASAWSVPVAVLLGAASLAGPADKPAAPIRGKVLSANGVASTLTIDRGSQQGVVSKMFFDVYGQPEVVRLPLTGDVVVELPKVITQVQVIEVRPGDCDAQIFNMKPDEIPAGSVVIGFPVPAAARLKPSVTVLKCAPEKPVPGARVTVSVTAQHPEGDPLTFRWSAPKGGRLSTSRTVRSAVEWTAPAKPGDYAVSVQAVDSTGSESEAKEISISVGAYPEERHKVPFKLYRVVNPAPFFEEVSGVAVDRSNALFVTDSRACQVRKVDADGVTVASIGQKGGERGQFKEPTRACAADESLYVVDKGRHCVIRFNQRGEFLLEYGEEGTANGQLGVPEDVAVSPRGDVYVADSEAARVVVYDEKGVFLFSIGRKGAQAGNLERPVALEVDREGVLYVLDQGRGQLLQFDREHRFRREIKVGPASDFALSPMQDAAYLLYPGEKVLRRLLLAKGEADATFKAGGVGEGWGQLQEPVAVACDAFGSVLVADNVSRQRNLQRFSEKGACTGRLGGEDYSEVRRVAAAPDGDLFCLSEDGTVRRLSQGGWTLARFGGKDGSAKMRSPVDLVMGAGGHLYVLDGDTRQLKKFKEDGTFVSDHIQVSDAKQLRSLLDEPTDLCFAREQFYLMDYGEERIQILKADGAFAPGIQRDRKVEKTDPTEKEKDLDGARYLSVSADGRVVAAFSSSLKDLGEDPAKGYKALGNWGRGGSEDGQFKSIAGLDFDAAGNLWVLDKSRRDVQRFRYADASHPFLSVVRDSNRLASPVDLACTPYNELWVWDDKNGWAVLFVQE